MYSSLQDYGLDKLEFTSFVRITGYNSLISASDASYAITALLESDTPSADNNLEAFHIAYDALNSNGSPNIILNEGHATSNLVNGGSLSGNTGIGAGIRLVMALQKNLHRSQPCRTKRHRSSPTFQICIHNLHQSGIQDFDTRQQG
jgi:hypothetical protein